MSKLILISPEHSVPNEIFLVQQMMAFDENLRFHLRKANWSKEDYFDYLMEINPLFYPRISIHEYHDLQLNFPTINLHYKEADREDFVNGRTLDSTSFHAPKEAEMHGDSFDYFFCSPVFPSISKKNYASDENWDISQWSNREKAVALGGIDAACMPKAKELGFTSFALLGSIWLNENPFETFKEIHEICQK